jgi:bifunctional non-homologous end joining protein LigD
VRYREQQPTFIPPMLLTSGALPSGDAWTFEVKWDGCRGQLRYDGRSVLLRTRNGRECSADFSELAAIAGALGKRRVTLDGELVCLRGDGRPDFARLRHRLTGSPINRRPAMLQVFDLLHLDGHSTRSLRYGARRALLEELALDGPARRTPASFVVERSEDFVARVEELGLEGVVAKRLSSTYIPGRRCTAWVKRKLRREERLAVTGIRRNREGHVEAIFVARRQTDGSLTGAGAIELHRELVERLEGRLAELPDRRRGRVAWYPAEVSVLASLHGLPAGPVRDAVLREVLDDAVGST